MSVGSSSREARVILGSMILGLGLGLMVYMLAQGTFGESFVGIGASLQEGVQFLKPVGTIFIRLLKMIIVPLVFSSIFMAIVNLGTPKALGSMGRSAVSYYFMTTAVAVAVGLVVVNILNPGIGADLGQAGLDKLGGHVGETVKANQGLWATVSGVFLDAIPVNPVAAMANMKVIQIIVFALLFAMVALFLPKESEPVVKLVSSIEKMTLQLTYWIMKLAPLGIFVLMLDIMAKAGVSALVSLSRFIVTVLLGLGVHALCLLILCWIRSGKSPLQVVRGMSQALLTAFSTASSTATLPITMANVERNMGVRKETTKFVLPLGATINMDGTALYESVSAIFIAQAYGIHLSLTEQMIIFLTASLAAVGAAAIPGAGLITMGIVLSAVGLPLEGIGLILAVDRFLDMFRTMINVLGDSIGCLVVDSKLGKVSEEAPEESVS